MFYYQQVGMKVRLQWPKAPRVPRLLYCLESQPYALVGYSDCAEVELYFTLGQKQTCFVTVLQCVSALIVRVA